MSGRKYQFIGLQFSSLEVSVYIGWFYSRTSVNSPFALNVSLSMTFDCLVRRNSITHRFRLRVNYIERGTWLAQSKKHVTVDLGSVSLSPMLGAD